MIAPKYGKDILVLLRNISSSSSSGKVQKKSSLVDPIQVRDWKCSNRKSDPRNVKVITIAE